MFNPGHVVLQTLRPLGFSLQRVLDATFLQIGGSTALERVPFPALRPSVKAPFSFTTFLHLLLQLQVITRFALIKYLEIPLDRGCTKFRSKRPTPQHENGTHPPYAIL